MGIILWTFTIFLIPLKNQSKVMVMIATFHS